MTRTAGSARRPVQQGPVLGVHAPGPRVEALGPVQGDGGDAVAHLVARDLQLGELHLSRGFRSASSAACRPRRSGRTPPGAGRPGSRGRTRRQSSSLHQSVTTSHSSPWRAVVRRRKPDRFGMSSVCSRLSRARKDSSLTPSASRNVVTSTTDIAQACTSMRGLPSGSVIAASVGPPGTSKGSATMVAPRVNRLVQRGAQVGDLDVEGHAGALALPDVPGRPGLGPADAGLDLHDEALADLPIEEVGVERLLALGVLGLDLPVHHGPGPVLHHRTSRSLGAPQYRPPSRRGGVRSGTGATRVRRLRSACM